MNRPAPWLCALVVALLAVTLLPARPVAALEWPGKVEEQLKRLGSGSSLERLAALKSLEGWPLERLRPLLLTALEDVSMPVREEAARMAADRQLREALPVFTRWLSHWDTRRRILAADSLALLGSPDGIKVLVRVLGDPEQKVRLAVIRALGQLSSTSRQEVPALVRALEDTVASVRIAAVAALAAKKDGRAVIPLMAAMRDSSSDVRLASARALGALGDAGAGPVLVEALEDTSDRVVTVAMDALASLAYRPAVEPLIELFHHGRSGHRDKAAATLASLGGPLALDCLTRALASTSQYISAQKALVGQGAKASDAVIRLLQDPSTPRQVALRALHIVQEARLASAVPVLLVHLERGRLSQVRLVKCLGIIGDPRAQRPLLALLESPFTEVRRAALSALEHMADARAVQPIISLLRDRDRSIKLAAVKLLGGLTAKSAVPQLSRLATDKDTALARAAAEALWRTADANSAATLLTLLDHADRRVRRLAAQALTSIGPAPGLEVRLRRRCEALVRAQPLATCLHALGGILRGGPGQDKTRAYLLGLLGSSDTEAFLGALHALAGMAHADIPPRLIALYPGLNPEGKLQLVQALGSLDLAGQQVPNLLLKLLKDPTPALRAAAALSLGLQGSVRARQPLKAATRDPHWMVRVNITAALALLANPGDRDLFKVLAMSRIPAVRANALLGLARSGGPDAQSILARSLTRDRYPWARLNALRGLLKHGFTQARLGNGDQVYKDAPSLLAAMSRHDMDSRVRIISAGLSSGDKAAGASPSAGSAAQQWLGLYLQDHKRLPLRDRPFMLVDGMGLVRVFHSDAMGEAWLHGLPAGSCHVEAPSIPLLPLR